MDKMNKKGYVGNTIEKSNGISVDDIRNSKPEQLTQDELTIETVDLVSSDLPLSEVIDNMSKRVFEARTQQESWKYHLTNIFPMRQTFDGTIDVNYKEFLTFSSTSPFADTVIDDFNSDTSRAIRFTYEAKLEHNIKTKILNSSLINFRANPSDNVALVFQTTENIEKEVDRFRERELWADLSSGLKGQAFDVIDSTLFNSDIEVDKDVYKTLLTFETTTKGSTFVGNTPLSPGAITKDGISLELLTPAVNFSSSDFYVIVTPEYASNIEYDGNRFFFNWNGNKLPIAGKIVIDPVIYEGIDDGAVRLFYANMRVAIIHKDKYFSVLDWQGSKFANSPKLYEILHSFLKWTNVPLFDLPAIIWKGVPTPIPFDVEAKK